MGYCYYCNPYTVVANTYTYSTRVASRFCYWSIDCWGWQNNGLHRLVGRFFTA